MRRHKYRAWDKKRKELSAPFLMNDLASDFGHCIITPDGFRIDDCDLMQYIGKKDKNGVEIYEGYVTNYGVVKWFDGLVWDGWGSPHPGFYFEITTALEDEGELIHHIGFDDDIQVIGNIYEHQHLLEVK